jgi:serine/threonine protein kinase
MDLVPGESQIGSYVLLERIGAGSFASVWIGSHEMTGTRVAIKVIEKASLLGDGNLTRFTREVALLRQFRHPFIAEFFESLEDSLRHYCVLEYIEGGTLTNFVGRTGVLSETQARYFFGQLICVLDYLHHEMHVAHRDLKADNILLDRNGNLRVIDFGLSNQFSDSRPQLSSKCGSPAYAAPEMIMGQSYTRAADIWSAGVCLYLMTTGCHPFDGDGSLPRLMQQILHKEPAFPSCLSPALIDLLRKMLTRTPAMRITLEQIKEHCWFSQTQYSAFLATRLTDPAVQAATDKEIFERMTEIGLECKQLHSQLVIGESTQLTTVYRILLRERQTDAMNVITQEIRGAASHGRIREMGSPQSRSPEPPEPRIVPEAARGVPRGGRSGIRIGTFCSKQGQSTLPQGQATRPGKPTQQPEQVLPTRRKTRAFTVPRNCLPPPEFTT